MGDAQFYTGKLRELVGGTIENTVQDHEGEYFGLLIKVPTGKKKQGKPVFEEKTLWLLSDDEGNAPGSFDID